MAKIRLFVEHNFLLANSTDERVTFGRTLQGGCTKMHVKQFDNGTTIGSTIKEEKCCLYLQNQKINSKYCIMSRKVVLMKTTLYLPNYQSNLYETWTHFTQDVCGHFGILHIRACLWHGALLKNGYSPIKTL